MEKIQVNIPNIEEKHTDEDIIIKDGMPYCKKCGEPRFYNFNGKIFRSLCKCQSEKLEKEKEEERKQERIRIFKEKQKLSMLGSRYQNAFINKAKITENNKKAYDIAKVFISKSEYCKQNNIGIYIFGNNSSGKTYLTACICNELLMKGYSCIYTSMPRIISEIQNSFNNNGGMGLSKICEEITYKDFLFIDDLGKEFLSNNTKFTERVLLEILNTRYNNGLPVIFTSNYSLEQLSTEFKPDKAILERINEMATINIELNGDNFRDAIIREKEEKLKDLGL